MQPGNRRMNFYPNNREPEYWRRGNGYENMEYTYPTAARSYEPMEFTPPPRTMPSYYDPSAYQMTAPFYTPPSYNYEEPQYPAYRPNPFYAPPTFQNEEIPSGNREEFPSLPMKSLNASEFVPSSSLISSNRQTGGGFSSSNFKVNPNAHIFIPSTITPPPNLEPPGLAAPPQTQEDIEERKHYSLEFLPSNKNNLDSDLLVMYFGKDLITLEPEVNSPEKISSKFASPFSSSKLEPSEIPEFTLPSCYFVHKPILRISHIPKFALGTLFYIFYNMPGEMLQALAAEELYRKGWVYEADTAKWYTKQHDDWKTFDVGSWELGPCSPPKGTLLTPEDVKVKRTLP